jgi:uncharacterized linocin/CFP29 family protein
VEDVARQTLAANHSARRFVDVTGPNGVEFACVPLGRLTVPDGQDKSGVCFGVHQVLPLVEARIAFTLEQWELDNIGRGAKDVELEALVDAARELAAFEEKAIYDGFEAGCITGIHAALRGDPIELPMDDHGVIDAICEAQGRFARDGVEGDAALVVGPAMWRFLSRNTQGGTLRQLVQNQIGGAVVYSGSVDGALLASLRGGDAELTLGQDIAIGYSHHDSQSIHLYLTESFTFRVIAPEAMVGFRVV